MKKVQFLSLIFFTLLIGLFFTYQVRAAVPPPGGTSDLRADAEVRIAGRAGGNGFNTVAPAGDVNGDGIPDLIMADGSSSRSVVVFGPWSPQNIDLDNLGSRGFMIEGC